MYAIREQASVVLTFSCAPKAEIGGCYARPTLDTIEKYALAVGARIEIRVRPGR